MKIGYIAFILAGGLIIYLLGFYLGANSVKHVQQSASVQTAQATSQVANQADWVALKGADDKLITSCSESFGIVSDIFTAQQSSDTTTISKKNADLEQHASDAANLAAQRNIALKKLGYSN